MFVSEFRFFFKYLSFVSLFLSFRLLKIFLKKTFYFVKIDVHLFTYYEMRVLQRNTNYNKLLSSMKIKN
jgi:hypothetical protein